MLNDDVLRVFIGYDKAEPIGYHVCCDSIIRHASKPVMFYPIGLENSPQAFTRKRGEKDSTEFAIARFLTPFLCDFKGYSLFMDSDIVVTADISDLFSFRDENKTLSVVKHNYTPKNNTKFLGQEQTKYQRKNWSSVMLFNNSRCTKLTPEFVNTANGLDLHQFKWCEDEEIGSLPVDWNYLVGEGQDNISPNAIHYTVGGPYFSEYEKCEFADEWFQAYKIALTPIKL